MVSCLETPYMSMIIHIIIYSSLKHIMTRYNQNRNQCSLIKNSYNHDFLYKSFNAKEVYLLQSIYREPCRVITSFCSKLIQKENLEFSEIGYLQRNNSLYSDLETISLPSFSLTYFRPEKECWDRTFSIGNWKECMEIDDVFYRNLTHINFVRSH